MKQKQRRFQAMTKKNRQRVQGNGQNHGKVRQAVTPPVPPVEVQKAPAAAVLVPVSTVPALLLTVADLCALLNVSRSTLLRLEKSGSLPGRIMLGGQVRYHREKIERWLLEQCG
jgi:excisionase family DNA binding protein